jgi:hypothetical protein
MTEQEMHDVAIKAASAVTEQFAYYKIMNPPPQLDTIRALVTAAVYKATVEAIRKQQN